MARGEAPLADGVVGGESLLGDGVVGGDGHGQDAGVGDDTARGGLATVAADVRSHCEGEGGGEGGGWRKQRAERRWELLGKRSGGGERKKGRMSVRALFSSTLFILFTLSFSALGTLGNIS